MSDLHKQLPHYVLAKNTRSGSDIDSSSSSSSSGKVNHSDDLFDPLYESDEIDDTEYTSDYRQEMILPLCFCSS